MVRLRAPVEILGQGGWERSPEGSPQRSRQRSRQRSPQRSRQRSRQRSPQRSGQAFPKLSRQCWDVWECSQNRFRNRRSVGQMSGSTGSTQGIFFLGSS